MKKNVKRISAIAALLAFTVISGTAVYAADTQKGEIVSAKAEIKDAPLTEETVLYQDRLFTIGASPVNTYETAALEEDDEGTLVSEETYIEGDYKYVDKVYCRQVNSPARGLTNYNWWGTHEVYYDLNQDAEYSMHLGTMKIEGTFANDPQQNISVIVDTDKVKCTTTKIGNDKYPIIFTDPPVCRSDVSDGDGQPRYARVTYKSVFVKAANTRDIHYMSFTVNSNNEAYVSCYHYSLDD